MPRSKHYKIDPIVDDPRPIKSISWGERYGDGWWAIGHKIGPEKRLITKIVVYREDGHIPWVAVYVGDEIVARSDCAGASILYE